MTIKFSKEKAKRVKSESVNLDGNITSQSIEVSTPSSYHFIKCRVSSMDDLLVADTCKLFDPDGEKIEYIIQCDDEIVERKIFELVDFKVVRKYLAPMIDCYGSEFLWPVAQSVNGKVSSFCISGKMALEKAMRNWVKITWGGKGRYWVVRTAPNQEQFKEAEFSKITDEEIINIAYYNRILTDTNHESLKRYQGV